MKNYIKHMSEQTHRIPSSPPNFVDKWSVILILTVGMLWLLRWPVLFIVFLLTELIK